MGDPFFVCEKLVDVPAVRPKQALAVVKPDIGGGQLIRIKGKKKGAQNNKSVKVRDMPSAKKGETPAQQLIYLKRPATLKVCLPMAGG